MEEGGVLSTSVGLRVGGIFVILAVSLLGALISLHSLQGDGRANELGKSPLYLVTRMFGAGIMLGVAFMHLLADANADLTVVSPDYTALAMVLASVGCILVLATEQTALYLMLVVAASPRAYSGAAEHEVHTSAGDMNASPPLKQGEEYHGGGDCTCKPLVGSGPSPENACGLDNDNKHEHDHEHSHEHHIHGQQLQVLGHSLACTSDQDHADDTCSHERGHAHAISLIAEGEAVDAGRLITKAVIMEVAIAIHSVIIGVAFGALGDDSLDTIRVLFAALSFHQFFEGIALGASLASARRALGGWKVAAFVAIFVLTTPLGIVIGMLAVPSDTEPSADQQYAQGVLNALAAGNLIYIALVEMVAEDMSATHLAKRFSLKALMVAALVMGDLCMAILAIWA